MPRPKANRDIGKIIREKRRGIPLSLKRLSAMSGVSITHLSRIEKGERGPSPHTLQLIAQPNVCMQFNRQAEEFLSANRDGSLQVLSYEEALAIIDAAEEAGLIHRWQNSARMVGGVMCNCCSCCCDNALLAKKIRSTTV